MTPPAVPGFKVTHLSDTKWRVVCTDPRCRAGWAIFKNELDVSRAALAEHAKHSPAKATVSNQ